MDMTEKNVFELQPDEEYDKFCGKVFLTTKKNVIVHCILCETKFYGFQSYVHHTESNHLIDSNESMDEEYLEGEDDEDLIEEELPLKLLRQRSRIQPNTSKPKIVQLPKEIEDRSRRAQIVTSEKGVLSCPHCPKRFLLEYALRAHIKEHDTDRRFKCPICDLQCKSTGSLQTHLRRHEKNKPHKCTECDRSFTVPSELQYHMRIHTGEKPYQCESCGVRFAYKSSLRIHVKRHHTFQRDYVCPICSKAFYRARFLRDHVSKHTEEPSYECKKCGKKFKTSSTFGLHKKKHRQQEQAEQQKQSINLETTVRDMYVNVLN